MQIRRSDDRTLTPPHTVGACESKAWIKAHAHVRTHTHNELQCCSRYAAEATTTELQHWNLFSQVQAGSARVGDLVQVSTGVSVFWHLDLVSEAPSGREALQANVLHVSKTGGSEL